ncbi:MAG: hypothetical protein IT294_16335 [Deltaproteobacteria bacterium]|nr:hypothetical protein [Deltaproteobacteria bacterium]
MDRREVKALIAELFTPVSREDVVERLEVLQGAVEQILSETEGSSEGDSEAEAGIFVQAWNLPRRERTRLIAQLLVGEAVLRRLEREHAEPPTDPPVAQTPPVVTLVKAVR